MAEKKKYNPFKLLVKKIIDIIYGNGYNLTKNQHALSIGITIRARLDPWNWISFE